MQAIRRFLEAEGLYKQCMAILRSNLGDQHPTTQTITTSPSSKPTTPHLPISPPFVPCWVVDFGETSCVPIPVQSLKYP